MANHTDLNQTHTKKQGRPKSAEKRNAILKSAGDLFLDRGYNHTAMDEVSKVSLVSKQTLYSHFKNKEDLFKAVIEQKCQEYSMDLDTVNIQDEPIEHILVEVGRSFIELLTDPQVIAMYAIVIGEAKYNPSVAKIFYDAGPAQTIEMLSKLLQRHPDTKLSPSLSAQASHDFFNLLKGDFHMRSMLHLSYNKKDLLEPKFIKKIVQKALKIIQ